MSLLLSGCAGGDDGGLPDTTPETSVEPAALPAGEVGFFSFVTAGPERASQVCEELFGSNEALSQVFLVDVALDGGGEGECRYRTATGSQLDLRVSAAVVPSIAQSTKGDVIVSLSSQPAHLSPAPALGGENRAAFQEWLDSRALALVDDYESWRASLPSVEVPFALLGEVELDPLGPAPQSVHLAGALETPAGRFEVRGASRVGHLVLDPRGERTSAGEGRQFLVVRTDGVEQAIDLVSGEVQDEGRGERLAARGSGMILCSRTGPLVRFASGREEEAHLGAYDTYVRWSRGPWVEGLGWAGSEEELITVTLEPDLRAAYLDDWKKVIEPQVMRCPVPLS